MKKILCFFNYHNFKFVKSLSNYSDKIGCIRCARFFAINYDARVCIPFTRDIEKFYETIPKKILPRSAV